MEKEERKIVMSNQEGKVFVRVTASQQVRYDQTLEFSKDDWTRFKLLDEKDAACVIEDRLDLREVVDADSIEDFDAEVVDEDGKGIKPSDSYGG
jgi:hypothetical protein